MTTDKQTDYFAKYSNVEVITSGEGYLRVIGQLKNGRWALWQTSTRWGGNFRRPERLPYREQKTFATKEEAIEFSSKII